MHVNITPIVKNKGGDITDIENYRAIAVSNVDTKLFERILLVSIERYDVVDNYQFGFKKRHSTSLCTETVKNVIDYYTSRGSHVFMCFVDVSKAFDRVNYWKLFSQLLSDGIDIFLVKLLAHWYVNQEVYVTWNNRKSSGFLVSNGTKQGGVLSPY